MNIKEYEKIINKIEKHGGNITKMYFVYQAKDFDSWQEMTYKQKEKLINYTYSYWLDEDLNENYVYNIMDLIFNSHYYAKNEILENIDKIEYKTFCNIINEKI